MIKVGDTLPAGTLSEFIDEAREGSAAGPNAVDVQSAARGKRIALFAVPGAFTPTCSEQHLPGYISAADALRAAGVDEIWCIAVNDPFVMGAWGRASQAAGAVRMLADGSGTYTSALGLTLDLSAHGLGLRSQRYSMIIEDAVVKALNVETDAGLANSDAQTLLNQL